MRTWIPRSQWNAFVNDYAHAHHGWLTRLDESDGSGERVLWQDARLGNLKLEQSVDGPTVTILAELPHEAQVYHGVALADIQQETTDEGTDSGLELLGADGSMVHLRFRASR